MQRLGWIVRIITMLVLATLVTSAAYMAGFAAGTVYAPPKAAVITIQQEETPTEEEAKGFSVFWEAWHILENSYYGELPSFQKMVYAAIRGVLSALDDPHTSFLDPKQAALARENLSGSFEGIGAVVDMRDGRLVIVEVLKGQPAEKAGLKSGDIILKVDDTPIENMTLMEAVSLIRGPKGTPVRLTILREGEAEPFEVTIIRQRIEIPVVEYKIVDEDIAYLKLMEFSSPAAQRTREALKVLLSEHPRGLILDLRDNPGGLLDVAVEVGSQFVGEGPILIERFRGGQERVYEARKGGLATDPDLPLVVLVNSKSASASEIVAGAIQDSGRGILIGEKTYGKGSVQQPYTLSDGSELRVTVARWFTPKGRAIHQEGLEPDIEVKMTEEDIEAGRDPQLDKAIEYINSLTR